MARRAKSSSSSGRGSSGSNALSQLTTSFLGGLYAHKAVAKSGKNLKAGKVANANAKVYADSRSPSKRSRRTNGRSTDDEADPRLTKISVRERNNSILDANGAVAINLAAQGAGSSMLEASARPPSLGSLPAVTFKDSMKSLSARLRRSDSQKRSINDNPGPPNEFSYFDDDLEGEDVDDDDDDDSPAGRRRRAIAAEEQDEMAYFSQRGSNFDFKVDHPYVLHPHGRARAGWDCFLLLLIFWMMFSTPFELSFKELSDETRKMILTLDYFLDCAFAVDIILSFFTAVEFDGKLHFSFGSISRHYLGGWFMLDLLLTIPFYSLTHSSGADMPDFMTIHDLFTAHVYPTLRIFRLCRIISISRIRRRIEYSLRISASSSSLVGFAVTVLGLSHFFSCMFAFLAFGDDAHLELALNDGQIEDDSIATKYIAASYWSMMTIATVGYGDLTVKTNAGRLFSIIAMVIGGGIFAYGISSVVDLIQQLYVEESHHRHKMDQVNMFMHHRKLPRKLRDEVRANFFHLRKATRENKIEDRAIVLQMSRTMQSRVADLFCEEMMPRRMPTLAGCNADFIHELYLAMEVQCYLPGEDIIRQDDFGTEMYFLFVGHVQVYLGHTRVAMFGPNSCFGEFAIMNPKKPRLATIQAMDFCETHCIERQELLKILVRHPFVLQSIKQLVQLRFKKALNVINDSQNKSRTLLQGLAALWHNEGPQGLLPADMKLEEVPTLHESAQTMSLRLASVRSGLIGSIPSATGRRRSITATGMDLGVGDYNMLTAHSDQAKLRRKASDVDEAVSVPPISGPITARIRRVTTKTTDGMATSGMNELNGHLAVNPNDDRFATLLNQMQAMLRRQERLESQVKEMIATQRLSSSAQGLRGPLPPLGSDRVRSFRAENPVVTSHEAPV